MWVINSHDSIMLCLQICRASIEVSSTPAGTNLTHIAYVYFVRLFAHDSDGSYLLFIYVILACVMGITPTF